MKLKTFINNLKKYVPSRLSTASKRILNKEDTKIIALLKAHSPVDTGNFRDRWKAVRPRFRTANNLAGILITNDTPKYGQFVAGGAEPGVAPWYYPHRSSKTGRFKKGTGKLKLVNGKVWAGGLNPGHNKTVGGPINIVLSKYTNKFTQEFSDEIVKGFI